MNHDDLPVQVGDIELRGLKRTDPAFLQGILAPCRQATTLSELKSLLSKQLETISRLSLFKNVQVLVDSQGSQGGATDTERVRLQVEVEERRFSLKAGTELRGQGEAALSLGGAVYNLGGRGEMLDVHCSLGSESASPLLVLLPTLISDR